MRNILAKELKIKFVEALNGLQGFSYEEGNPFIIKLGSKRFFVFLKNLSPAYFKNLPDITRVQLPYSEHFDKIFKANIPFVILGYDVDNDTFVCWNPKKSKERLNAKSNVSLYSRNSLQSKIKAKEFKPGYLSTGEKIIIFRRESLPLFFDNLPGMFDDKQLEIIEPTVKKKAPSSTKLETSSDKLHAITDKKLLADMMPLLKKNRVLEAVEVCTKYYGKSYKGMGFKDWFNLVDTLYKKLNDNS